MSPARRNIELKARIASLDEARRTAERIAVRQGEFRQVDTYFHCRRGRLKLRETAEGTELIGYDRDDRAEANASDYRIYPCPDAEQIKALLAARLGVLIVVEKTRELFLLGNVRIHLDRVTNLGEFLEFEAVLDDDESSEADEQERHAHEQIRGLKQHFNIGEDDLIAGSYSDLLDQRLGSLA